MTVGTLEEWSREFGGQIRVSRPRVTLGQSPAKLLTELYRELVAPPRAAREKKERIVGRADILHQLDTAIAEWNVAPEVVVPEKTWRGKRAEHLIDRAFVRKGGARIVAIAHAVSFQAAELPDVYGARGALIVATDDLRERARPEQMLSFALYADGPKERASLVRESARLFHDHDIMPVSYRDLSSMRSQVASVLPL